MKVVERVIGIVVGAIVLAASPALAAPGSQSPFIDSRTADDLAAQRVPGEIVATRLDAARSLYHVDIRAADNRIQDVEVDAHNGVVGVRQVTEPGMTGEIEAP